VSAPLDSKVAVVTGGATGIGFAIVTRLVADGARVVVAGIDDGQVASAIAGLDPEHVTGFVGDLSVDGTAGRLLAQAVEIFRGVDILVNNAGGGVIAPTLEHTPETIRHTVDNNLMTTVNTTIAFLPHLVERGGGRIVNVGAESVRNGLTDHAVYNAAKGGVHAFAVGLAREFAHAGITVNVVSPSYTRTDALDALIEAGHAPPRFRIVLADAVDLVPVGRPAEVDEVAAAVAFLARDDSRFITGQVLCVNGGSSMG
jgi:2,3-dihydroxy-2,3-dihydro-p-cumate dehydrogenase